MLQLLANKPVVTKVTLEMSALAIDIYKPTKQTLNTSLVTGGVFDVNNVWLLTKPC